MSFRSRLAGLLTGFLLLVGATHATSAPASGTSGGPATAPATVPASRPADSLRVTLLHVNDAHGQLEGRVEAGKGVGGYARLATAADRIRGAGEADRIFFIHAGDEFSKGDALTMQTHGRANVAIMNHLRFDFWTPGNGEFYDGLANLRQRMAEFKGRVVLANIVDDAAGKPVGEPFVIERIGGLRIAFLGLGVIRTERPNAKGMTDRDPIATARELLPQIRAQADVVVAVTHIGYDLDKQLAAAVAGIDVIVGGHSHTALPDGQAAKGPDGRRVLIAQAGSQLSHLGRVDLVIAREQGAWSVRSATARLTALDDTVKLDPAVTALIARLAEGARAPEPAGVGAGK